MNYLLSIVVMHHKKNGQFVLVGNSNVVVTPTSIDKILECLKIEHPNYEISDADWEKVLNRIKELTESRFIGDAVKQLNGLVSIHTQTLNITCKCCGDPVYATINASIECIDILDFPQWIKALPVGRHVIVDGKDKIFKAKITPSDLIELIDEFPFDDWRNGKLMVFLEDAGGLEHVASINQMRLA